MSKAKEELRKAIKSGKMTNAVTSDGTLHLYSTDAKSVKRVEADILRILRRGYALTRRDGTKEVIRYEVIVDSTKEAAARYTWDAAGEKVKHDEVLYTYYPDGREDRKVLRKVFRVF